MFMHFYIFAIFHLEIVNWPIADSRLNYSCGDI